MEIEVRGQKDKESEREGERNRKRVKGGLSHPLLRRGLH